MRRALSTLAIFAAFVVTITLFRGEPGLEVTVVSDGAWDAASCRIIPDGAASSEDRAACVAAEGRAAFELMLTNQTKERVVVPACTVEITAPDGGPFEDGTPIIVPIAYVADALDSGDQVSMTWFVPWLGPDVDAIYEATCDPVPSASPARS